MSSDLIDFATQTTSLFSTHHKNLLSFKMTQLLETNVLDDDYFRDDTGLENLGTKATELTTLGESFFSNYSPQINSTDAAKIPRKVKAKKFVQIQYFGKFLEENANGLALIDVGSGVGHLSNHLSTTFSDVTAIDQKDYSSKYNSSVKFHSIKITDANQISNLAKTQSALIGLHSCGSLTPLSIRTFTENERIRKLALVSCCYHKMTDHDLKPMSNLFKDFKYSVGFLRLACQRKDFFEKKGLEGEVEELWKKLQLSCPTLESSVREKLKILLKSHNYLQRLSELVVLLDRKAFLEENNLETKIYRLLPTDSTPRGEVLYSLKN